MIVDRSWITRNLGIDPIAQPIAEEAFEFKPAARSSATPEDFQRDIIEFDSESPAGTAFFALSTATGLSDFTPIAWPAGLAPQTGPTPASDGSGPLPKADILVVTWTVDEGHALSRVLTPGKDSRNDYVPYTHNFATIAPKMVAGCPARKANRLGAFWPSSIGGKSVLIFKSDSHMSQDGPALPNADVWRQIIAEVQPKLVLTTGTGGGIGADCEVGDVIVSAVVRFDCQSKFKNAVFAGKSYASAPSKVTDFTTAQKLFAPNAAKLPTDNTRPPRVVTVAPAALDNSVVTTDFFGFDTSDNHYGLQGLGDLSEMGDAVLGMVASELEQSAPRWLSVRNVSDPQIKAEGSLQQQAGEADTIYKGFGRWSSICSAIVCWSLIVAEKVLEGAMSM